MQKRKVIVLSLAAVVLVLGGSIYLLSRNRISTALTGCPKYDLNQDGIVNDADYLIMKDCWYSDLSLSPNCVTSDIDSDNVVGTEDYSILRDHWFETNSCSTIISPTTPPSTGSTGIFLKTTPKSKTSLTPSPVSSPTQELTTPSAAQNESIITPNNSAGVSSPKNYQKSSPNPSIPPLPIITANTPQDEVLIYGTEISMNKMIFYLGLILISGLAIFYLFIFLIKRRKKKEKDEKDKTKG